MPSTLIILENHTDTAARQFLKDNAINFKKIGYGTLLFELDKSIDPDHFFRTMQTNLNLMQGSEKKCHQLLIDVYLEYKQLGFVCEFIDPEPILEAAEYNRQITDARARGASCTEMSALIQRRIDSTNARDVYMSHVITEKSASSATNGVISLGGFAHVQLIQRLQNATTSESNYRYTVISGGTTNIDAQPSVWPTLAEPWKRANYYGMDKVEHFDIQRETSFEMFESIMQLSPIHPCTDHVPSIKARFNEVTNLPFEFHIDEQLIVTASLEVRSPQELFDAYNSIKGHFPGLQFFGRKKARSISIDIPGMNLPENAPFLKQGL